MKIIAPHDIKDPAKLKRARLSDEIRVRCTIVGNKVVAIEGSHRLFWAEASGARVILHFLDPKDHLPDDDNQFGRARKNGVKNVGDAARKTLATGMWVERDVNV